MIWQCVLQHGDPVETPRDFHLAPLLDLSLGSRVRVLVGKEKAGAHSGLVFIWNMVIPKEEVV